MKQIRSNQRKSPIHPFTWYLNVRSIRVSLDVALIHGIFISTLGLNIKGVLATLSQKISYILLDAKILDAKILADLLRADLAYKFCVLTKEFREKRSLIRHRISLVRNRTIQENRVYSLLDKYDYKTDLTDIFGKSGMIWLKALNISHIDKVILNTTIAAIENINLQAIEKGYMLRNHD
jgi:hypothetical protein